MTHQIPPLRTSNGDSIVCTAHRYALNTWHEGAPHPRHHCTVATMPHATQPHACACGYTWTGVGALQCSHCGQDRPAGELRKLTAPYPHETGYVCVDELDCARTTARAQLAASTRTIAANSWGKRPESDSAAPGVPAPTNDPADTTAAHVAGALGVVVGLLNMVEQADPAVPVSMRTIMYALGMARRELERAAAGTPPHIRQPGDPVGHGAVTDPWVSG